MEEEKLPSDRVQRCYHQRCPKNVRLSKLINSGQKTIRHSRHQNHISSSFLLYSTIILLVIMSHWMVKCQNRNVFQEISENPELTMFKDFLEKDIVMQAMFKSYAITVFAPNNVAMKKYLERNPEGLNNEILKYHIIVSPLKLNVFERTSSIASFNGQLPNLYLSVSDDKKQYYVNNALIIHSMENIRSDSNAEQTLFIIDEVLSAFKTTKLVPPTALELIKDPSIYGLENLDLGRFLQQIQSNQLESVFSDEGSNTYFVPTKISNTKDFDAYVVKAHVIKSKALFERTMGERRSHETLAHDDDVDVEVSFVNKTLRFNVEKTYYIQSNTVKNNAVHKPGRVLSRLIKGNVPVKNGVIHIIDKPLMLMDMSVRDFLKEQPKLKRFQKLLDKHPSVLNEINRNPNKTVLAPDDNAFNNLIDNNQNFAGIGEDSKEMENLLRQHIVYQQVSSSDLKRNRGFGNYSSAADIPVVFRLVGTEPNQRLTVESGGVNATSSLSDFGASDGILHIIDRVLGMPFNTIYEKLINNPMLNETLKIGSQGGMQNWNAKLADQNKRYTFFAPSNEAWKQFQAENPSEFKQLDTGIYPSIARAILDRHISAKGQHYKKDLEQMIRKIDTVQGELIVSPDPTTRDIYIEWEGKRAKITQSDIVGYNGVVHVIDQVLAKRRDFKVNSAYSTTFYCHQLIFTSFMGLLFSYWIYF